MIAQTYRSPPADQRGRRAQSNASDVRVHVRHGRDRQAVRSTAAAEWRARWKLWTEDGLGPEWKSRSTVCSQFGADPNEGRSAMHYAAQNNLTGVGLRG